MKEGIKFILGILVLVGFIGFVSAFSGNGTGTLVDPYQITNCSQLFEIDSNLYANYSLVNNVNCSSYSTFSQIGSSTFYGTLDGNHYNVTGINLVWQYSAWSGMIRFLGASGVIKRIHIYGGNVQGSTDYVATLVGLNSGRILDSSTNFGTITVGGTGGGLVAYNDPTGVIDSCYSQLTGITGNHKGGLVGNNAGLINNSYSVVTSIGGSGCAGGVAMVNSGNITNSYSISNSTSSGDCSSGGITGNNDGRISNCFFVGRVTRSSGPLGAIAGLSGGNYSVINTYFNNVSAPSNCLSTGTAISCTGIPNNISYFKDRTNSPFTSWDFSNKWSIDPSKNNGYPYPKWMDPSLFDIVSPLNNSIQVGAFNLSFNATSASSLWFYNESENVSYTAPISLNIAPNNYTYILYMNYSNGTVVSENLFFEVQTDVNVSFTNYTEQNNSYKDQTYIYVEVSLTGLNFENVTYNLYDNETLLNSSNYSNRVTSINWTNENLSEGIYYYNITAYDIFGTEVNTETRRMTLDRTEPNTTLISPANGTQTADTLINFTANVTDNIGIKNATLYLYKDSQLYTGSGTGPGFRTCEEILDDSPSSPNGLYSICPDGVICTEVYCDMDNGGWASIFKMDSSLSLDSENCIFNYGNDDMDSVTLWEDLTTKISSVNNDNTDSAEWFTWQRDGTETMDNSYLPNRPDSMGSYARPVPLPFLNKTIWFDWENYQIVWISNGTRYSETFTNLGITGTGGMEGYWNNYYFISDGISMIHTGYNSGNAVLIKFNFVNDTVTGESATTLSPVSGWFATEEDNFGNVLYTVNGRLMYYAGNGNFRLAGTLSDPNNLAEDYSVNHLGYDTQHGLDFFARVDNDGYLWFADWGHDDGGYFNCGNDDYLGVARSNILLTYQGLTPTSPSNLDLNISLYGVNFSQIGKVNNLSDGIYEWSYLVFDMAGNSYSSENRTLTVDSTAPILESITDLSLEYVQADLDPNETFNITANISDLVGVNYTILQVYNGSWTNYTMERIGGDINNGTWNTNFTLDSINNSYVYNIWTNDSLGNIRVSSNYSFNAYWDCTWNITNSGPSQNNLGSVAGFNTNKYVGNVTLFNTGDSGHASGCSLTLQLSQNLLDGRIYFNNQEGGLRPYYILGAKNNTTVLINANYTSSSTVIVEDLLININEVYDDSETSYINLTGTLVTSKEGPYIIQELLSSPAASILLTPTNLSFNAYIQNVMGNALVINPNNTAYNVSSTWVLPNGFTNISGALNYSYDNLTSNNYNYQNAIFSFESLAAMTPGTKTFELQTFGYSNLTEELVLINESENDTLFSNKINITFQCYGLSDGVYVTACGNSDGDYPTQQTGSSGGGGGGGGGAGGGGSFAKSSANFELVRGDNQEFELTLENKLSSAKKDITITVKGNNSQYVIPSPNIISYLGANSKENVKFLINAPSYFASGKYLLEITFSGTIEGNVSTKFTEVKYVTLTILEMNRATADEYFNSSLEILSKMNSSGLILDEVQSILDSMNANYESLNFNLLKEEADKIEEIYTAANEYSKLKDELNQSMIESERNGITTTETKKLFMLAEILFNRGDYVAAYEKMKEAKTSYLLETKGEFKLIYAIKNNPIETLGILVSLSAIGIGSSYLIRFRLLKRKIKMLIEEEGLLLQLMRVIQRDCFENNKMSMNEYNEAMYQYEARLSDVVKERVKTETVILNLMKLGGKERALNEEKKRLFILLKQAQEDYLNRGKLDTRVYENMLRTYSSRLNNIEQELVFIEAKEKISQATSFWRRIFKINN